MARRLARGARLVLASHNEGKQAEFVPLLAPFGVDLVSAGALGLAEPVEDAADFVGNAGIKARAAASASGLPALADDSGFCVAGLGGAPGVVSARWAGQAKDFSVAMARVQSELGSDPDRRAWFVCALCLGWPDGHTDSFMGIVRGLVIWPPRGDLGFGYDPIFVADGQVRSFAELTAQEKHEASHRARAFQQLTAACLPAPIG